MAEENDETQQQRQRDIQELRELLSMTPVDICVYGARTYADAARKTAQNHPEADLSDPDVKWNAPRLDSSVQVNVCELLAQMCGELLVMLDNHQYSTMNGVFRSYWDRIDMVTGIKKKPPHERTMEEDSIGQLFIVISGLIQFITG